MFQILTKRQHNGAMEAETIKNAASPKSQMSRINYLTFMLGMCFIGCFFMSCNKDEPTPPPTTETDTYTPPANISREEIVSLILDAEKATYKIKKISIATHEKLLQNGEEYQVDRDAIFDAEAKRFVTVNYRNSQVQNLSYVEGNNMYYYSETAKELQRPITNADQYYYCNDDGNWINEPESNAICKVEKEKIIVIDTLKYEDRFRVRNKTYIFNAAKQCKKIILHYFDKDNDGNVIYKRDVERLYTYGTANPVLPNGFSKGDFTNVQSDYYSVKVIWGEGKGENTFWVKQGTPLYTWNISNYAPEVSGKKIIEFTINGTTYSTSSNIEITDNNTEINVVWGTDVGVSQMQSKSLINKRKIEDMTY